MVEIQNVSFSYENEETFPILHQIHFSVHPGECILLCGASGCGKTTITKLINGLIPHFEEGSLTGYTAIDEMIVADTPLYQLSQKVGSVFQNPKSQFFNIDSDSELAFGLENNGTEPLKIKNRLKEVTEELHISHLLHRNVFSMSGGEKQTLAFASVYAMNPDVYVLDEPSANLDMDATENLRLQIQTIKEQGKTVIIAEHRLSYLRDLADRIFLIKDGSIQKEYSRKEFLCLTEEERHQKGLRSICPQENSILKVPDSKGQLEIKNLTFRYQKKTVFENLSFAASPGKILGILGQNGAGKSTLLRCIAGLQKEASGSVLYHGKPIKLKQRNQISYMIMQDVNHQLFGNSVLEECRLSCAKDNKESETEQILRDFDLWNLKDKHPMALSSGQKQRLAIVTGILAGKQILMFDEPSSGLDYAHMCTVGQTLRYLSDTGHIVIVVTHDLELLNSTCDQVFRF